MPIRFVHCHWECNNSGVQAMDEINAIIITFHETIVNIITGGDNVYNSDSGHYFLTLFTLMLYFKGTSRSTEDFNVKTSPYFH